MNSTMTPTNALAAAGAYGTSSFLAGESAYRRRGSASSRAFSAVRPVAAAHVVLATRAIGDAWAAKQGIPAPRGGPA